MLHIPFLILTGAADGDLSLGDGRVDEDEVDCILQLISETKGASTLVETAAGEQTASDGLIDNPTAHSVICCRIRSVGAQAHSGVLPLGLGLLQCQKCRFQLRERHENIGFSTTTDEYHGFCHGQYHGKARGNP